MSIEPQNDPWPLSLGVGWVDLGAAEPPAVAVQVVGLEYGEDGIPYNVTFRVPTTASGTVVLLMSNWVSYSDEKVCKATQSKSLDETHAKWKELASPTVDAHPFNERFTLIKAPIIASKEWDAVDITCQVRKKPSRISFSQREVRIERERVPESVDSTGFVKHYLRNSPLNI